MIHQDRTTSRTRERERDQTHSYWYIPSAPRENYSLLVMESTGMMKMATGEGFPLRQGAGTGLDWLSVATEAYGGGTPDLLCSLKFFGYMGIYGRKKYVGGPSGCPRGTGARRGGWAPPHPRGQPGTLLVQLRYAVGFFWSKNKFREVSGQLDSV